MGKISRTGKRRRASRNSTANADTHSSPHKQRQTLAGHCAAQTPSPKDRMEVTKAALRKPGIL
jgi:hypothetical protein